MAKLLSADTFEIYLLTLHLFPMGVTFFLARIVIASELAIGILISLNLDRRFSLWVALAMLAVFSTFLIYLVIVGNTDNCHCFGELIDFSPAQSIFKNIIIAGLCIAGLFARPFVGMQGGIKSRSIDKDATKCRKVFPWKIAIQCAVVIASFVVVFIISVPDNWRYSSYSKDAFNQDYFSSQVRSGTLPPEVEEGSRVVCFFSTNCNYCRMASKKLEALIAAGRFDMSQVVVLFPESNGNADYSPQHFLEDAGLLCSWQYIGSEQFVRCISGEMPMIVILQDGQKQAEFGYRDLH